MAVPDREIVITYGAYSVGGSTGIHIDGKLRVEDSFTRGAIEFTVTLQSDTQANLATACAALETAYRDPYNTLTVTMGGSTFLGLDADGALEAQPSVVKEGSAADTGLSRSYRVRIEYGRPADNVPNSGLRSRAVTITYTPARQRTVTISGTYTAVSGTDARAKYQASIAALASAVLSAIDASADFELVAEVDGPSSVNDKTVEFSRQYEEILYSQAGSSNDRANIVRQTLRIRLRNVAPGDTPEAKRLGMYDVEYSAWIDAEQTQNLASEWAVIQPWLVSQVRTASGVQQLAVVERTVNYDYTANRIDATMAVQGVSGDERIENTITVQDDDRVGLTFLPVWSGNPIDRLEYQGPRDYIRTITARTVFLGAYTVSRGSGESRQLIQDYSTDPAQAARISGGQWRIARITPRATQERRGLTDVSSTVITVTVIETTIVMQYINPVSGSDAAITPGGTGGNAVTP